MPSRNDRAQSPAGPELDHASARDIFWMLTGRDVYRMLVRERVVVSEIRRLAGRLARSIPADSGKISPNQELAMECCDVR
jgi:hypothetical protein